MIKNIALALIVSAFYGCNSSNTSARQESQTDAQVLEEDSVGKENDSEDDVEKLKEPPINNLGIPEDSLVVVSDDNQKIIYDYKNHIENLDSARNDESRVELFAKVSGLDTLVFVPNVDEWPENIETSYNVLRDLNGRIIYIAAYPVSESGDWSLGYRYYFNDQGKAIIFLRESSFFNSDCTDGVAKEMSAYFFNSDFVLIGKEYDLKNTEGVDLRNKHCFFPYHYDYEIVCCLKDLMDHIKMEK